MCASYDFCSHVEVSTKGRSLVQRSPTDCVCVCVCVCVCFRVRRNERCTIVYIFTV